jgi:hypothetical protein
MEYGFIIMYQNGNVLFQTPEEGCANKEVFQKSLPDCCHYYLVTILMGIKSQHHSITSILNYRVIWK